MSTPKISIIIPIYNAAAYIEQCIGSVLNQTMQEIEVIAVNDGSTDNSAALLDALAVTDQRVRVFHNSNKGVSATRNFGLQLATGTYIGFCDADDFMEPTMLEELLQALESNACDWAFCNVRVLQEGKEPKTRLNLSDQLLDAATNKPALVHGLMRFYYDNANWNKLFRTSIIKQHNLSFAEDMRIWEDLLFNLQYLQHVSKVAIIAKPLYNYRIVSNALYSGATTDLLPQFNLLYKHYLLFTEVHEATDEAIAFKSEMARITYNQLLYKAEVQVFSTKPSFMQIIQQYKQQLNKFNPAIFYYPSAERKGVQGIKKQLLHTNRFGLFAFIIAVKPWLRKPYKAVRRLLKN